MSEVIGKVVSCIKDVFKEKGVPVPDIGADTLLDASLGLDSLDYAELVVRLEMQFGIDPFATGEVNDIRTVADLASLYEKARS